MWRSDLPRDSFDGIPRGEGAGLAPPEKVAKDSGSETAPVAVAVVAAGVDVVVVVDVAVVGADTWEDGRLLLRTMRTTRKTTIGEKTRTSLMR